MDTIYLDHAATTPLSPVARAAMEPFLGADFGNPSSGHPLGVRARAAVDEARASIARALGTRENGVIFTSGGTEANNLAVLGIARAQRRHGRHVLFGSSEHASVREAALALKNEGFEVEAYQADADRSDLERKLRPDTVLVAQMLVNNEFGRIYPVGRLARHVRARAPQARLHVDAIQAVGKLEFSVRELGAHSVAISGHKIGASKGIGALLLEQGTKPRPLQFGGDQENGLRSGTENVAAIVGLARALESAVESSESNRKHFAALRALLRAELDERSEVRLLEVQASQANSPAICPLLVPQVPAEVWMHHLEVLGVFSSVGSACHARKGRVSPALRSLGLGESETKRILRWSFGVETTAAEVRRAVGALCTVERNLVAPAGRSAR